MIVKEIRRRLLPEYVRLLTLAQEGERRHKEADAAQLSNLRELCDILNEKIPDKNQQVYIRSSHSLYGELTTSSNSADLHLRSVPMPLARIIAKAIYNYEINN